MRKVLYILGELEDSDLQWLADAGSLQPVTAGTEIVQQDVRLESLFIVFDGELAARVHGMEIARLGRGEIVGDMSLLDSRPPGSATVMALEDSTLFAIPQDMLRQKLAADYQFAARFYKALCIFLAQRLSRADSMVGGKAAPITREENEQDELSEDALQATALAGARFDWFVKHVRSQ